MHLVMLFLTLMFATSGHVEFRSVDGQIAVDGRVGEASFSSAAGTTECAPGAWDGARCDLYLVTLGEGLDVDEAVMIANQIVHGQRIATSQRIRFVTVTHELLHVYDGMDDGLINGSPGHPRPEKRPYSQIMADGSLALLSDFHWAEGDDAHWYVYEALRTGRLR